jgi:predicted ATP-grasp superfamily ATP-dependent carboligase
MARVLLISDEEATGLLWGANAGGHDVYVTGVRSRNPTVSLSSKCKRFFALPESASFTDPGGFETLADTIAGIAQGLGADVIVPTSFESLKFAILQRDRLATAARLIPLASMEVLTLLDDKHSFHQFCLEHGLPHPASCLLQSPADLDTPQLSELTFPLITKPLLGAAERGIERFDSFDALRDRIRAADADFFPVLAQEWFDGEDIDFNGYALDGEVAVSSVMRTTRYRGGGPEVRLTDFVKHQEISRLGHAVVRKSGFTGPLNIDLRIRRADQKVFLIEVNPRFWGRSMACLRLEATAGCGRRAYCPWSGVPCIWIGRRSAFLDGSPRSRCDSTRTPIVSGCSPGYEGAS